MTAEVRLLNHFSPSFIIHSADRKDQAIGQCVYIILKRYIVDTYNLEEAW